MNTQIQQSSCSPQSRRLIHYREHTELLTKGKEEQTSTLTLVSKYYNQCTLLSLYTHNQITGLKKSIRATLRTTYSCSF